ncbi:efflux RND transporter periplasmic adaptor subunit [Paraglaciecola polaris]|uniref:HlyD family secretion protein n=1 Tax=Paraglaciecola polaris LMG 21857 TaxID=1129793 RepID=K7ABA9_9ALTE|nr:HlyD family efflux transporter periplasmic adaptor subunit [Paraglaciecola polaris]GAC32665.1 HlyD family secretion protein [Paraglaciecola polaris LMG 21857]|tara:strand:- start:483 stop:1814 length:1332 start_codon:yes stop_codon:yes gene_type:complete
MDTPNTGQRATQNITDTSAQDIKIAPKKGNRPYWLGAVIITCILLLYWSIAPAVSSWQSSDTSVSAKRIHLSTVVRGDLIRDLSVQGRVVAAVSPRLYSPAQGTINLLVDAGDSVQKDQVIAQVDSPELTNELQQEESSLQKLKMELDRQRIQSKKQALENQKAADLAQVALIAAQREKRRADKAFSTQSISQIDFEKAQDELENAKLVFRHAQQDADLSKESLAFEVQSKQLLVKRQALMVSDLSRKVDKLDIRSPVNGIVGNLAAEQKNQVAKNQAILSVVDLSEFELEVDIPESYADDLAINMPAIVGINGVNHLAILVTISPEIENNQVTGRVRFATKDEAGTALSQPQGLRQNQRLTTRILMEKRPDVLMLSRGQFLESGAGRIAYVVEGNIARRTDITTGARSLSSVEVVSGLRANQDVIISSTEQFNDAQTVLITQ